MENFRKDSAKQKKDKEDEKLRKWSAKKKTNVPKWQVLNQMAKILPLQTTQIEILVRHFFANKHSITVLQGPIYYWWKAQTIKLKLPKGLQQNTN